MATINFDTLKFVCAGVPENQSEAFKKYTK